MPKAKNASNKVPSKTMAASKKKAGVKKDKVTKSSQKSTQEMS